MMTSSNVYNVQPPPTSGYDDSVPFISPPDFSELFQQRVVQEEAELNAKIAALTTFINVDNPVFSVLPDKERNRLILQLYFMNQYDTVLKERLQEFEQP